MRILYIDNISPIGHVQYNRINLEALCKIGNVFTAMRKGYFEKIGSSGSNKLIEIPDSLYMPIEHKWKFLIYRILRRITGYDSETQGTLKYVRDRVEDNWDAVIISHMEPKSLSKMDPLKNVYAVCHQYNSLINTGVRFVKKNNRIKYTIDVGNRYTIIALSDSMMKGIKNLKVSNVKMVPHGFLPINENIDSKIFDKLHILRDKKLLFIPSYNHKADLNSYFYDSREFDTFLEQNDFYLVIKDKNGKSNNQNVKVINSWLSESDYQSLFLSSFCVILPYDNNTSYRESGVIMECFANNKLCLRLDTPSLHVYDQYFNYESYFSDISSLKERLLSIEDATQPFYRYLDKISNPYHSWYILLNK
ncbi:hypothetical protein SDC9_40872 [bioreactor metagenome]|uniref:Glycosyltransferase subfamily 4-like N-terminal domain-containing protein n=1 Tax=bioreactor metagenome TaxID=1076179 RepID=A0A644VTW6_9ZZZZ